MNYELSHPLFQKALPLLKRIENAGFEGYFVGGCVRDTLLKREIHDIDIASSALPNEIESLFPHTIDLGKEHGTIIVVYQSETFEITTFRVESEYSDFRRPDHVQFVRNLKEDTLRRDFTINALALDRKGKLYDYHGGLQDLNDGLIRAVGQAQERFIEDALRMIRAIRFASQLGFKIEENTLIAIQVLSENIQHLSMERIRVEFSKFLQGKYLYRVYPYLFESNLADYFPKFKRFELEHALYQLGPKIEAYYQHQSNISERLIWALLLSEMNRDINEIKPLLKQWTHSNKDINDIIDMIKFMKVIKESENIIQDVYLINIELLSEIQLWFEINEMKYFRDFLSIKRDLPIQDRSDIKIQGQEIIDILKLDKGGPIVGKIIQEMESKILMGQLLNEKVNIRDWILLNYKD